MQTVVLRVSMSSESGMLTRVINTINAHKAEVMGIDISLAEKQEIVRDITIEIMGDDVEKLVQALTKIPSVTVSHFSDPTFLMHLGGKIEVRSKEAIQNRAKLSMAYTPGVARVCQTIADDPDTVYNLTMKRNMVAIVTDGSAVLGLGNIGPRAALPVMEGKAMLLKDFAGVDAFPICLDTQDSAKIIEHVIAIAPSFGAVNLEDISAPRCFDIEAQLREKLKIPVFHDDQHGTAIVIAAALMNALKVVDKSLNDIQVVISGVGAAGHASMLLLKHMGVKHIIGCDSKGILSSQRDDLNAIKKQFLENSNSKDIHGSLADAVKNADVFIGLSAPNILTVADIQSMNKDPIVFAMSNPDPEIDPKLALPHVAVMATGRSDYPNQINNVLAFPGIFRGLLDCRSNDISLDMYVAAANAIANVVDSDVLSAEYIVPSVFNRNVVKEVAAAIVQTADES